MAETPRGILISFDDGSKQKKPEEIPERFVTSDAEALHAATIRDRCAALNDAVTAAGKDGLVVTYEARYDNPFGWSPNGESPAILLTPTILRKL